MARLKYRDDMTQEEMKAFLKQLEEEYDLPYPSMNPTQDEGSLAYFDRYIAGDRR